MEQLFTEINKALTEYDQKWQQLISSVQNQSFFKQLKPVSIGWKVEDQAAYKKLYGQLRDQCDITIESWMNERWVAKTHLKNRSLNNDVQIIKLMQRRPGSNDSLGLDHIDFLYPSNTDASKILAAEDINWSTESNDILEGYEWLSIWFDGTEAKLKPNTVIDVIIKRLDILNQEIKT